MTATGRLKTGTVNGCVLKLRAGRRYVASRPMMSDPGQRVFEVRVTDITDADGGVTAVGEMTRDEADEFLRAFNNGPTSWQGRVW